MSKAKKIILAVGIFLLVAVVSLSVALTVIEIKRKKSNIRLNNIYEKSYYEALDSLNNVSTKLSKVTVLSGVTLRQELLNDIWRECGIAATNLAQLSESGENLSETVKTLNQIGDYSHYLSKKLAVQPLSETELEHLSSFYKAVGNIRTSLSSVQEQLIKGNKIDSSILSGLTAVTESISKINYNSVDYPELIYDGPFSDGLDDRETKYLNGMEQITSQRGIELIEIYFKGAIDIQFKEESAAKINSFLYSFKLNGIEGTAQITKNGGKVAMFDSYSEITNPTLSDEECLEKAQQYMVDMGYENMKPVWISNNNSTVYINFAYCENDIVYYPDLIKIKINSENGHLIGVEAQNFIYNHTPREIIPPANLEHIAISSSLDIKSRIICLIPTEWNKEILCLEVTGTKDEQTYYIYYNIETGEEERVLLVIDEDGQLLI